MSCGLLTYALTITIVKVSILLLYRRVFDTHRFRTMTVVLAGICVSWGIVAILCTIFQCHPVSGMWKPEYSFTSHCIDIKAYYTGLSASNMVLDIMILTMPVYMVWKLSLPLSQRLALIGIFLLGGL